MLSFNVALALTASITQAYYTQGYGHGASSYQPAKPSYGHQHYQRQASTPLYGNYNAPHQSHSYRPQYDPNSAHVHAQAYGPTVSAGGEVGWWSQHSQYSPPLIKYEIAEMDKPLFAVCDPSVTGNAPPTYESYVTISQKPNEAAKLTLGGVDWALFPFFTGPSVLRIEAYEYGVDIIDDTDACQDFDARGEIFHPLKEEKLGVENPYADPERGLIKDIPAQPSMDDPTDSSLFYTQNTLLWNLAGPDTVIGRALFFDTYEEGAITKRSDPFTDEIVNTDSTGFNLTCCVIVVDVDEDRVQLAEATEIWHGHVYQQYHQQPQPNPLQHGHRGYNNYGQRSYGHSGHY